MFDEISRNSKLLRYLSDNKIEFSKKMSANQILTEVKKLKDEIDFTEHVLIVNDIVNATKCLVQHQMEHEFNEGKTVVNFLIRVVNLEWRNGLKDYRINGMIFNVSF